MITLIAVRRYDNPEAFGLHTNQRLLTLREGVYWALGLFTPDKFTEVLSTYDGLVEVNAADIPLQDILDCAPIEWHKELKEGKLLDRFRVLTSTSEAPKCADCGIYVRPNQTHCATCELKVRPR